MKNHFVPYANHLLRQKAIWRHGDTSTCPILLPEVSGGSIPDDLDRIRLRFNDVAARENNVCDGIELEYQLQIIMSSVALP
ncbi:MAG TPA: hypothetical protein VE242_01420 [Chthoniobacterales bacterium]|nr:hypothetical protein [Chthoniobacterales bacterium]